MKFTKEQKDLIKKTKIAIQDSQKLQEKLYETLIKILPLDVDGQDKLYDYIFNNFGNLKSICK